MSKKKKNGKLSSEAVTCFRFAVGFAVVGVLLIIFGKTLYHSDNMVNENEIITGQTATIISVDKVNRNLSPSDKKLEEDKGYSGDELLYEYSVTYQVTDNGTDYTYDDTVRYHNNGSHTPRVGDTEVISYAIKNGELIVHPETTDVNQFVVSGWFLIILGILATAVGFFIRK